MNGNKEEPVKDPAGNDNKMETSGEELQADAGETADAEPAELQAESDGPEEEQEPADPQQKDPDVGIPRSIYIQVIGSMVIGTVIIIILILFIMSFINH